MNWYRFLLAGALLFLSGAAAANPLRIEVTGVDDQLRDNIRAYIGTVQKGRRGQLSDRVRNEIIANGIQKTWEALRPFGYYSPVVDAAVFTEEDGTHVLTLRVTPGERITFERVDVSVVGEGAEHRALSRWKRDTPFSAGYPLDQPLWETNKKNGLFAARQQGFLSANFSVSRIDLDLETGTAAGTLELDTSERWVMGDVDFGDHVLRPGILESIPRFEPGDYYRATVLDRFRLDLQQTGYFTDIEILEERRPDTSPPSVDLRLNLETAFRNRYQGALGYGTDTGIRVQTNFSRQPVSSRGDRIDIGLGWREVDEELALRTTYRIPRRSKSRRYWVADATLRRENRDLEVKRRDEDKNFIKLANGNIDELNVRAGELRVRNRDAGDSQVFTTWFGQGLTSNNEYAVASDIQGTAINPADVDRLLRSSDNALSVGVEINRVDVQGRGFGTVGRRDDFWAFTSVYENNADSEFTQIYAATRRTYNLGDRYRFLFRGEIGFTDAKVDRVVLNLEDSPLELSVTRLPVFYRFRAGGSASVRGYGFEQLSNNNVGSNNIITASVELEARVLENWSGAVFVDTGNAFNDWDKPELKTGIGFGIRWYSIAGPIRLDVAQATDFTGRPWRIHFTIGSPLL